MKRTEKTLLCLMLLLVLLTALAAVSAYAEDYNLWVCGVQVTSENKNDIFSDGSARYDGTGTQGTLSFSNTFAHDGQYNGYMVYAYGINLTVRSADSGVLTLNTQYKGIYSYYGSLTVGSEIDITAASYCLSAYGDLTANLKVTAKAEDMALEASNITLNSDVSITETDSNSSNLINSSGDVAVHGSVTIHSASSGFGYAIFAGHSITIDEDASITGGLLHGLYTASGNIAVNGNLTISGNVQFGVSANAEYAPSGAVTMLSGIWDISATQDAITAKGGISIPATHGITTPVGGVISQLGSGYYAVTESDGTTRAAHAVIQPVAPATYTITSHIDGFPGDIVMVQESAAAGTTVTVTTISTADTELKSLSWSQDGGATKTDITNTKSFVMPAHNVDVYAVFQLSGGGTEYTITVHPGANGAAGVSQNTAAPGTTITVNAVPFSGYEVKSILWSADGGATKTDITDTASFVMPASNADVYVEFQPAGSGGGYYFDFGGGDPWYGGYTGAQAYRLRVAPTEHGSVVVAVANGQTSTEMYVYPQTAVSVYAAADPGYALDSIVWSLDSGEAAYDITQAGAFVMPAMDVTVRVSFRPIG